MNIGDTFVDPQKQTWTVEAELGHGTWGRSFRARNTDGRQCVVKVAHQAADFPQDAPLPEGLVQACREAAREQIALLQRGQHPFLPRLLSSFTLSSGAPVLMLPWYSGTLERRIASGTALTDAVELLARLARELGAARFVHGNLRPSNVLINERGEPVVSDPVTPALAGVLEQLQRFAGLSRWLPPEAQDRPSPGWDTWALCQCLYQAALHREIGTEAALVDGGLDRVEIATLKDRALARLKHEKTNPRFQSRMSERLGSLLHRGLSLPVEPSPPYRFADCGVLAERLEEVAAMVSPHVEDVGRLLPPGDSVSGVFRGDKPVEFTVSVGCSAGVTHHEDVVCGLRLLDLDADERIPIPEAQYKVERHRSGRLRFQFTVPDLPPGRFRLKIAFTVRDSGAEPHVAASEFEVRPRPGYVPPVLDDPEESAPIVLDRVRPSLPPPAEPVQAPGPRIHNATGSDPGVTGEITLADPPSAISDPGSDPGAEVIEGLFPRPIAPPTDQPERTVTAEVRFEPVATQAPAPPPQLELIEEPRVAVAGVPSWSGISPAAESPSAVGRPGPSIGIAMPNISIGGPGASVPTAPPAPSPPEPDPSARWFSGQLDQFALEGDGLLPGIHDEDDELPDWRGESPLDKLRSLPGIDLLLDRMQRDAYTAFVIAAAGSFVLLLLMMALLKAI